MLFYDTAADALFEWADGPWPLGFQTAPIFHKHYRSTLRSKEATITEWAKPWAAGYIDLYPALRPDFEAALVPQKQKLMWPFMSAKAKAQARLENRNAWPQLGLSLALALEQDCDGADAHAQAYFRNIYEAANGSDLTIALAMASYVYALIYTHRGETQRAADALCHAQEHYAGAQPVLDLYRKLTGTELAPPDPLGVAHPFPTMYRYQRFDPFDLAKPPPGADPDTLCLQTALNGLDKKELGFVCVMGRYRSNGPFLDDLSSLAALKHHPRHAPGFVHIITSFDGDPNAPNALYRKSVETDATTHGLELEIGFDTADDLPEQTGVHRLPTWFILNPEGKVLAVGMLDSDAVMRAIFAAG